MSNGYTYADWKLMESFVTDAFCELGVPREDAAVCADVLLEADRRGIESHGVNRFKPIYIDRIREGRLCPETRYDVIKETATTVVVDGNHGMGMVIARRAMQTAIDKAKKYGMGMAAVRNSTHYGIAGYYVMMAAEAGCIGITGTNARPSIAPTFGVQNMLGTNPFTFGMPTDEDFPFVLDCASSITQRAAIEHWSRTGRATPEGMVIARDGTFMTDSADILDALNEERAALVPLGGVGTAYGGHKGYGYAAFIEIMSAALQGGSFLHMLTGFGENGEKKPYGLGHFFIAIDCDAFLGADSFRKTAGDILRQLRASQKAPGRDRIYTPGEIEHGVWLQRSERGVPINQSVAHELAAVRDELGLFKYRFPFEDKT